MPELLHPGVYVQEVPSAVRPIEGVSTSTAAFIGVTDKGPLPGTQTPLNKAAQPVLVTSFTDYIRQFGGYRADSFLTYAVQAFFANGGKRIYIVRVAGAGALPSKYTGAPFDVWAATPGKWGDTITVEIGNSSDQNTTNNFKLTVKYGGVIVETFDNVTFQTTGQPNPANYARTVVNSRSEYIVIHTDFTARPTVPSTLTLGGGNNGAAIANSDYIGTKAADNTVTGTGLYALDKITDVNLIAIPGQGDSVTINAGMDYCKLQRPLQDCFFIADVGSLDPASARLDGAVTDTSKVADAVTFATAGGTPLDKSAGDYGAIYYPWVWASDPLGLGRNPRILLPPSGFMAGLYARIDNSRGVFKAPAGTEAGVAGALAAGVTISDNEQDQLNPIDVNVIRTVPGSGIVVWGTRTIGNDASWRYIPVRRMAIFLRVSIYYGIQWAVFEPNDEPLWASLRLNIRAFMLTQFRAGAFQGGKPDDAFFVKCDSSTTTQTDIDNGVVNILVGFAPLKPAEFVVLKLSQKVNQPAS